MSRCSSRLAKSICPVCKVTIDAEVNIRDEEGFLRKRCREHGEFEARVYGDAQMYVDAQRFNKPGSPAPARWPPTSARSASAGATLVERSRVDMVRQSFSTIEAEAEAERRAGR